MGEPILDGTGRQSLTLPAIQQRLDVLALERRCLHLPKTGLAQLPCSQRQRAHAVGLGVVAAVAVAVAKLPQGIGQVIHLPVSQKASSCCVVLKLIG